MVLIVGILVLALAAGGAYAVLGKEKVFALLKRKSEGNSAALANAGADTRPVAVTTPFPRRMLVLSASKYLYCNGLTNGRPAADRERNGDRVTEVARRLAFDWRIPRTRRTANFMWSAIRPAASHAPCSSRSSSAVMNSS